MATLLITILEMTWGWKGTWPRAGYLLQQHTLQAWHQTTSLLQVWLVFAISHHDWLTYGLQHCNPLCCYLLLSCHTLISLCHSCCCLPVLLHSVSLYHLLPHHLLLPGCPIGSLMIILISSPTNKLNLSRQVALLSFLVFSQLKKILTMTCCRHLATTNSVQFSTKFPKTLLWPLLSYLYSSLFCWIHQ